MEWTTGIDFSIHVFMITRPLLVGVRCRGFQPGIVRRFDEEAQHACSRQWRVAFAAVSRQASDHEGIHPTVAEVTQFVCQSICEELAYSANRPPWEAKWQVLQHDITV